MLKGAHYVHERLKDDLIHYLKSQYLGQSEILLKACADQMAQPGNLWSRPYIESSPAYESIENGIATSSLPNNLKKFFSELAQKRWAYTQPHFGIRLKHLKMRMPEKICLFLRVLVLVKPNASCGQSYPDWLLKQHPAKDGLSVASE